MNYYCLIAGLPDIKEDDRKTLVEMVELKKDIAEHLNDEDAALLSLLFAKYDNECWIRFLKTREAVIHPLGNLTLEDFQELLQLMQESEQPRSPKLLPFIHRFYTAYNDDTLLESGVLAQDFVNSLYYDYAMQNKNQFLREWFEFNLNINNVITAIACKKNKLEPNKLIVGNNEIAAALRKNSSRNFGLDGSFEYLELILGITEEPDLLEREKKIDTLKWNWLDEKTFFNSFSIEKVLAYIIQSEMIERWQNLSTEKGTQTFRDLLSDLKNELNFSELTSEN